jgi:uncharacterized membrane protein YoaK (UPF0700 family)
MPIHTSLEKSEDCRSHSLSLSSNNKATMLADLDLLEAASNDRCPSPKPNTFLTYINESIRNDLYLELQLLVLAFATGIQDACTYPDYSCFASNQTGNTVLLAIGVSGLAAGTFEFRNIAISLSLFVAGGWVAGQTGNIVGTKRRSWLLFSSFIQTLMVWGAVIIQYCTPYERSGPYTFAVLALLAFSASAQVAMARGVEITEITTAMVTAAYIDLLIDPKLYKLHNRPRNRRIAFLIMLAGGSFAGAFMNKRLGSAFALLMSAAIKTVVLIGLLFNKSCDLKRKN